MNQKLIVLIALVVLIGVGGFIAYQYYEPQPHKPTPVAPVVEDGAYIITLTDTGFVPADITITLGETVTFRSETGDPFWPASNLHPSHAIYSDFDPREPVQPSAAWSFTFTKAGAWQYHDHLAPYFTGTITVTE